MNEPLLNQPVAYFCAEFALENDLPTYAGGLGVLAGDLLMQAAREKFPLIGVGLLYQHGYIPSQPENAVRKIHEVEKLGLTLVTDKKGQKILISLPVQDRLVHVQAWQWQRGSTPVYLLDTNLTENIPTDQNITRELYIADKETRMKQEIVLGIGGLRFLSKLGIHPKIFHLNEGHSAFLVFELIKNLMQQNKLNFYKACEIVKSRIIFTNHTLVAAGNELFNNDMVTAMLYRYAEEFPIPVSELVSLGLVQETSLFSLTMLSLRMAKKINAVSRTHALQAAKIWTDHPMEPITNGIYLPRWDKIGSSDKKILWKNHQKNKRSLLAEIKNRTGQTLKENEFLVGWARRFVPYKRPLALLENIAEFKKIAQRRNQPIKVVYAGLDQKDDSEGIKLLRKLENLIKNKLCGLVVFLTDYDLDTAKLMTSGCDVWLNTPVVGSEACGTSGMKAALNGVLPITTKDGWVNEVELFDVGWVLDEEKLNSQLLTILENQIVPLYYQALKNPLESEWLRNMANARQMAIDAFDIKKTLKEYREKLYT